MDNISKEERSRVMAAVGQKNTMPEIKVRTFLHRHGLRYRLHVNRLPGRPDIVFPKYKTVLFVNGCFWHGHKDSNCKLARTPKSNIDYWKNKILNNQKRDSLNSQRLAHLGWKVLTIWECEINNPFILDNLVKHIMS